MNEARLHEFMGKFVTDMGGAFMMGMVMVGDELGLYKAMADHQPVTADALAGRCGCNARLVREWLDANAAAGYLEPADGGYRLPPEQAMALANEDSPVFVAAGTNVVGSCFTDIDKVLDAFRGDGGFPWGEHHHRPEPRARGQGAPVQGDDRPQVAGARHAGEPGQRHVEIRLQAELTGRNR